MRSRVLQNSLITGVISPTLLGRIDLDKYYSAVEEAENMVIMPHGGMQRRGGLRSLFECPIEARLFSFEFNVEQDYVILFTTTDVLIYEPDTNLLYATIKYETAGYTTLTALQLKEMDIIQSADTIIIVHEDFNPMQIQRQGSNTSWSISKITFTNIPKFDYVAANTPDFFNYGNDFTTDVEVGEIVYNNDGNAVNGLNEHLYKCKVRQANVNLKSVNFSTVASWEDLGLRPDIFGDTGGELPQRGYPRTCTFHQGRLWFGGLKSKPTTVLGSVVNDFFNFDTGQDDVLPDDAIFDILDTDQFNAINNIVSGTKLQVLTSGGEFVNTEEILTPTSSAWVRYTGYGAKRVKPVSLDGATYFMDRFGKTVRNLVYSFEEGGYITPPISILSEHIINNVQALDIVRGSSQSVANLLYLVNGDGTVAVFNTLRQENISGWTKWTTQGLFKDVIVTNNTVTFKVEREGKCYVEVIDDNLFLDHSFKALNSDRVQVDNLLQQSDIKIVADKITQTGTKTMNDYAIADHSVAEVYAGLSYTVKIVTLPIAINTQQGNIVHQTKRVTKCILNLYQSRGVYVNDVLITSRKTGQKTDQVLQPITGIESTYLLGYNNKQQVTITQKNPDPLTLLSLDLEVSF